MLYLIFIGVNISRSPGGSTAASLPPAVKAAATATNYCLGSATLSPSLLKSLNAAANRNRSSSLVVPPVIRRKKSSSGSPGSKSLHLSPQNRAESHPRKSQTLFTFPDPGSLIGNANETSADSGLSSILHVHERYLSSEDFHEALFFEKSPKTGQRKRSRKSIKNACKKPDLKLSITQL